MRCKESVLRIKSTDLVAHVHKIFAMMKASQAAKMMFSQQKKKVVALCMNILEYIFPGVKKFQAAFHMTMIRPKNIFDHFSSVIT